MSKDLAELDRIFDVPFTFSQHCCAGLVPRYAERCECWRCRKERGEQPDQVLAARVSAEAQRKRDAAKGEK